MNAKDHLTERAKARLPEVLTKVASNNSVVLVCERQNNRRTYTPIFVTGSGGWDSLKAGDSIPYTQDTGMGNTMVGYTLRIQNVIRVDNDGIITTDKPLEDTKARQVWVMK